jgi:hypothetical protein
VYFIASFVTLSSSGEREVAQEHSGWSVYRHWKELHLIHSHQFRNIESEVKKSSYTQATNSGKKTETRT